MASESMYFKGKCKWVRAHSPNEWGKWAMVLYPDNESLEKIRELQSKGLKNVIKKDDDGYNISISRPTQKMFKGKVQGFAPPKVLDKNGIDMGNTPVGNGSDGTVKCDVYSFKAPTGAGIAMRWEALRVDNLVPFEKESFDPVTGEQVAGLAEQSEHIF